MCIKCLSIPPSIQHFVDVLFGEAPLGSPDINYLSLIDQLTDQQQEVCVSHNRPFQDIMFKTFNAIGFRGTPNGGKVKVRHAYYSEKSSRFTIVH